MSGAPTAKHAGDEPRPIRIAFVIDRLFLPAGGTERQLFHLLENLDRRRFEPELFCLQRSDWLEQGFDAAPATVVDIHLGRSPAVIADIWRFSRLLRRRNFDIVQTHFRDSNIVGIVAASLAGVDSLVSTRRGVPQWSTTAGLWLLRALNRRVSRFLVNSEATRDRLVRDEGVDPSRVAVIHNGLDPERFRPPSPRQRRTLREGLDLPPDVPVVGIVANLREVKGLDVFLRAAARVSRDVPEARFVIAGDGPEGPALERLAAELDIRSRVSLLGARDDVPQLLKTFDVGVLASHFESFSNSILEYLACDLPVVVTDVGGAREAVREGEDGFVVPAGDPDTMAERILTLLRHPTGPGAWRQGRGLPPRFHLGSMVRSHEAFYSELVAKRSTPS